MAQFQPCFNYLMTFEDPHRTYGIFPDAGGYAISGINSAAWPTEYQAIAAMQPADRPSSVSTFYAIHFYNPLQIGGIDSQDVADRVMDMCVNAGGATGIKCLQRAANACGCTVAEDGRMGSQTLEAVNGLDPERILAAYRTARSDYYRAIVKNNPTDEKYLSGWLERATA